jgi:putative two-component system response regulator
MNKKYNLLLVDDEKDNLQLLARTLRNNNNLFMASSGFEALEILNANKIDLIISDQKMPQMDGIEFLKKAFELQPESIRILITAYADSNILIDAINTGKIYMYIKKPWNPNEVLNVVGKALEKYKLNEDHKELISDFKDLFTGTISAITEALDAKDPFTFGRSKRVCYYSIEIAKKLGLSIDELSKIEIAGLLHDIGMIGISEQILNKSENLSDEEYDLIKTHVEQGVKILGDIKQFSSIIDLIKYHHERYDGNGYPYGLSGNDIPIGANIIAIADTYDGLVSDRAYRKSLSHEEAVRNIKNGAKTQFYPEVVEAFTSIIDDAYEKIKEFEHHQE